jgi:hypothetical protein
MMKSSQFVLSIETKCWSQWPCSLRHRSTAACLLRSWFRIPPVAWMFVCCVCCQVEVSATSWSLIQRSPTDCGASCVITKPHERGGHRPRWEKINNNWNQIKISVTELAYSIQRLTVGWMVQGSNPVGGEIFCIHPDGPCGPPSLLYGGYWVSFPGVKRPRRRWPPTPIKCWG